MDIKLSVTIIHSNSFTCLKGTGCFPRIQNSLTLVSLSVATTKAALHTWDSGLYNSKTTSFVEFEKVADAS